MLYMVIERFKEGAAPEIDQRFRGVAALVSSTETNLPGVRRGERLYTFTLCLSPSDGVIALTCVKRFYLFISLSMRS
jgi:hypothetical protein